MTTDPTSEQLAALVRDFLDPDPCALDHHGYCQTHSWLCKGRCPHARAREVLAEYDAEQAASAGAAPADEKDAKSELLKTQAMHACLTAMKATEVHVYGQEPFEWKGTILENDKEMKTVTHWNVDGEVWRYETRVTVEVTRSLVEEEE